MKFGKLIRDILVLVMVALIVSGCGGAESRKAKYLERGKSYLEEQNYDKAIVEFKNVLQIDPKYAEAYFLYGEAEEGRRNLPQAFGLYSKAVELNPDHLEARVHLARFYLLGGALDKAKEQIDAVLAKQPTHTGALLVKAAIASREGKDEEAIKQASELIKAAPSEYEAYSLIAGIYLKQKKLDNSIEILQQGITANPKNVPLRLSLAQVYANKGDNNKAEEMLQECVSLEPKNLQYRVNLASFLAKTKQLDKAEKVLRSTIEQDPEDDQRYLVLVEFLATARKDTKAAEQELLAAIKKIPDSSRLRFVLANYYEKIGDAPRAADTYREIISRYGEKPDGLRARNQLAELSLRLGKQDEAEKLIEEVLKENSNDNQALLLKSRILLTKGNAPDAISALRVVLRDQPNLVDAYLYLAQAHVLNKEPKLAEETLVKGVETNPKDIKVRLALAQFYAQNGDLNTAGKKVDEALALSPDDYGALEAKYEILAAKKDIKGAQEILAKIKAARPDDPASYYQLGKLYMSQRKYDAAMREYEQALPKSKNAYLPMSGIVSVYVAQGKPEKAIGHLNDLLAKDPSSRLFGYELMAEVYITQKKYNEAEQALHKAIDANPTWNVPYRNLANLYLVRGDFSSASKAYQQGLQAIPNDPQLLAHLAQTYERTHDFDQAIATYERVLAVQPADDVAANNLASLLLDHRTDAESLKRARELVNRFESSQQPAFLDTLGWMYYRSGELDKAIDVLGNAVKQAPAVEVFRYHLGMAYYKKGDNASAKTQLSRAIQAKNDFPGIEEARSTLKQIQ